MVERKGGWVWSEADGLGDLMDQTGKLMRLTLVSGRRKG